MSPTAGVPICEGCGMAIRPHELASTPDWHVDCLNAAGPKRISVSCCAECPWLWSRGQGEHACMAPRNEPYGEHWRHVDKIMERPIWCPLPILVTAEEG